MKQGVYIGIILFAFANVLSWFQYNSQFVWDWWKDKPLLSQAIFAIPVGLCFWHATKNIVEATGELWAGKLLGFGVSNTIFAILTYAMLKESIFTTKTMVCMFLAILIILVQVYWK